MTARRFHRLLVALLIAAVAGAAFSFAYLFHPIPALDELQELVTDATMFRPRQGNVARRVALVQIDDRSVSELRAPYGRVFTWPRSLYARALHNLAAAGARVVVFDLLFDASGCPPGDGSACSEDQALASAIADASRGSGTAGLATSRVVLATAGYPPGALPSTQPAATFRFPDAVRPLPILTQSGAVTGHVQVSPDADGTVRRLPLVVELSGTPTAALSLETAASFLRRPVPFDALGPGSVSFAGRIIPTDAAHQARVNYLGPPSQRPERFPHTTVPSVSFVDVLDGTFDRDVVAGKAVFVGLTALGFADDFWVPTSRFGVKMSGVEIHAQSTEMLLQGSFLDQQGSLTTVLAILSLSLVTGAVLARWHPLLAGGTALGCFLAYVVVAIVYGLLSEQQVARSTTFVVLNSVYPGVAMLATTLSVMLYRIVFEQAEQRATRSAMGKYLSATVLDEVLRDPAALRLGGQKREMTVLFSDIRGFTPLSEQVDPERLVQFLNEYLTAMTDVVFAEAGVLDKYMGDGIMAFWGAPSDQPDHPRRACRTAYQMVTRLRELESHWMSQGFPRMNIGVGINSGVMTVGNVGSKQRFDYTVVGDAVNLAARLEEANKEYHTNIIVGEETRRLVADEFATRSLDLVVLRGRETPTEIHELLCPAGEVDRLLPAGFLGTWSEAMQAFRSGRYDAARAGFARCLTLRPDDGPSRLYLGRGTALAERVAPIRSH